MISSVFLKNVLSGYSFLKCDLNFFFLAKEFESGGLRYIDVAKFGPMMKKCLDLPNAVR